jgi:hypothetical protein
VDWQFSWDLSNSSLPQRPPSTEALNQLKKISLLSLGIRETAGLELSAWDALAAGLRHGRDLGIPDFRLEEASGLRGKFMLDLIAGEVNLENLISKPLPNR